MLFDIDDLQVFDKAWGWERVDAIQERIIPKLKILAGKMECLITDIYGSDILINYGHKSVPSSANIKSGYTKTGKSRRNSEFDPNFNNLSDVGVGITPNAKDVQILRDKLPKDVSKKYYDKVYGELAIVATDTRGEVTLGVRFGISSWARAKYHPNVYGEYAWNLKRAKINTLLTDIFKDDNFFYASMPDDRNQCHAEDINGILNYDLTKDGFAFVVFGERYLLNGLKSLKDYADIVSKSAAVFPLLDIFVRQVSSQSVEDIDYRALFQNWWDEKSEDYYSHFDLTSESSAGESKGEFKTRQIFEKIFGKQFVKQRPEWLKATSRSKSMELDGFNPELNLAFEYQGEQHYKYIPLFHKDLNAFEEQKVRDITKMEICKQKGITLLQIPYTKEGSEVFIINELKKLGYEFPN